MRKRKIKRPRETNLMWFDEGFKGSDLDYPVRVKEDRLKISEIDEVIDWLAEARAYAEQESQD